MVTDEKKKKVQRIARSIWKMAAVIAVFFLSMAWLTMGSAGEIKNHVEKIIQVSGSSQLQDIAKQNKNKAIPVLEDCVNYVKELEKNNLELSGEKKALTADIESQEAEVLRLNRELAILSSEGEAGYQLCHLFMGDSEGDGGAVYKEEPDDTIIYMAYAPRTEGEKVWERYDRVEVDMYKRNGSWTGDFLQSVSSVLPDDIEEKEYSVSIFLRTDASRLPEGGEEDQKQGPVNGGSVTFSVGSQAVKAQGMRMGAKEDGYGTVLVRGGEGITLKISPQDHTSFFSFVVCLEETVPNTEEGGEDE